MELSVLQQAVDDAGQRAHHEVVLGVRVVAQGHPLGRVGEDGAGHALDPLRLQAGGDLDAVLLELAAIDLEDLDLHHHLRAPLVHDVHDPLGRRDLVGGVVDGEGVAAGNGGHPARPEHHPQEVDRLLEVRVGEEQGLDHLLLELPPLGRSVGDDRDDLGVDHAVEGAAGGAEGVQGLVERDVAQVEGDRLVLELRIEDEIDAGGLAQCLVGLAQAGPAEGQAQRLTGRGPQGQTRQRPLPRPFLHLVQRHRPPGLPPGLELLHLRFEGRRAGGQVEGEAILVAGFLVEAARGQPAGGVGVLVRSAEPRPLQPTAVRQVVRVLVHGLRVLDDRAVVILTALRLLARPKGRGRGASEQGGGEHQQDGEPGLGKGPPRAAHPWITSTPGGTSNRKILSDSPTFSRMSSKRNRLRFPWPSSTWICRTRPDGSTSTVTLSISGSGLRGVRREAQEALGGRRLHLGRKLAQDVALAREQQGRDAALVVLAAHDDLPVRGHVEEEAAAVGDERLRLGVLVVPAHPPRALDAHDTPFRHLAAQQSGPVHLDEAGGEVSRAGMPLLDQPHHALRDGAVGRGRGREEDGGYERGGHRHQSKP